MTTDFITRKAEVIDSVEVANFVVRCIRFAFTEKEKIGPQEYFKSDTFNEEYIKYRTKNISDPTILNQIVFDAKTNQIAGYIEFGPKKSYLDETDCTWEILCFFVDPTIQSKGLGSSLLQDMIQKAQHEYDFELGRDSVGLMTLKGNPTIDTFYKKIGAFPVKEVEFTVSV